MGGKLEGCQDRRLGRHRRARVLLLGKRSRRDRDTGEPWRHPDQASNTGQDIHRERSWCHAVEKPTKRSRASSGGRQDDGVGVLKRFVRSQVRKYPSNRSPGPSPGRKSTSGISTACSGLIFRDIGRITLLICLSNGLRHSQQPKQPCLIPLIECLGGPSSPQIRDPEEKLTGEILATLACKESSLSEYFQHKISRF
jgi:hypothetical protein